MRVTRKATGAALGATTQEPKAATPARGESDFDEVFGYRVSDQESDASDYGKKMGRKNGIKKRKSIKLGPRSALKAPEVSDHEFDDDSRQGSPDLDSPASSTKEHLTMDNPNTPSTGAFTAIGQRNAIQLGADSSTTLVVKVNSGIQKGGAFINIDVSDLVLGKRPLEKTDLHGDTLTIDAVPSQTASNVLADKNFRSNGRQKVGSKRARLYKHAKPTRVLKRGRKLFLTDLPPEIAVRIYRFVFVTEAPIDLTSRQCLGHSSGFLATCKKIYNEGRVVLYGENVFHFERCSDKRGDFFEPTWKEIGYKDVRRFLTRIGTTNISFLRYVSFIFTDAIPSNAPYLHDEERRYVNDPVLHACLKLIGDSAHLAKFAMTFAGRKQVDGADYLFLKALASIRSEEVIHAEIGRYRYTSRIRPALVAKLQSAMWKPGKDHDNIDPTKKKEPTVKMFHERNASTFSWH